VTLSHIQTYGLLVHRWFSLFVASIRTTGRVVIYLESQVHNKNTVKFIRKKNEETEYTISNCAGAQLIGAAGIAKGHKIVTYVGGGKQLQKDHPQLNVKNDSLVTYVEDGRFYSSNGNLASYISALNVVEEMTSAKHRKFVESYLYLACIIHEFNFM